MNRENVMGVDAYHQPLVRLPGPVSVVVDTAVKDFIPLDDGPKPETIRRWHDADLWMVHAEQAGRVDAGMGIKEAAILSTRVTVGAFEIPEEEEPVIAFVPDLLITRRAGRRILPEALRRLLVKGVWNENERDLAPEQLPDDLPQLEEELLVDLTQLRYDLERLVTDQVGRNLSKALRIPVSEARQAGNGEQKIHDYLAAGWERAQVVAKFPQLAVDLLP